MTNWFDAASVTENIGVEHEKAEQIAADIAQLARDLESFHGRVIDLIPAQPKIGEIEFAMKFGVTVVRPDAYRAYARHIWQQTRRPRSVYRGGRWRQMSELTRVKAAMWALERAE